MVKISRLDDAFLEVFSTASKPSRRPITAAKRREKEKKERRKKYPKIEKPNDVGHFLLQKLSQNFDFCACRVTMPLNAMLVARKASCCVVNTFSTGLEVIWPRSSLKITQNVQKTHFLQRVPGVNGLITRPNFPKDGSFCDKLGKSV